MLEVKNAKIMYGDFVAVKNLSFTIKPGDIFGLLGTNGAGKTTTFRMIMGLIKPTEGKVLYFGENISYHNVDEIGYMIEERSLLTKLTVKELMIFHGRLKGMKNEQILKKLDYWLERFNVIEYKDKKIKELSKGNQQKIQFITALINDPKLLILDEPFAGLDPINTVLFVDAIREFQKKGSMVVFSSHQLDHVESFCEEVVVLEQGEAIINGNIEKIKDDFSKRNIKIIGDDIDLEKIKNIKGVLKVEKEKEVVHVKIADNKIANDVFSYIKTCKNIIKYDVEKASLSEIFVAKVGESRG